MILTHGMNSLSRGFTQTVKIGNTNYPITKIGNLWWLAENLHEQVGIYKIVGEAAQDPTYGYLYQKQTIANSSNTLTNEMNAIIDDTGWRMPSFAEWELALSETGGLTINSNVASKSRSGWSNNDNGTNENGLNIYPCGLWNNSQNVHEYNKSRAYLWCSNGDFYSSGISTRITFASNASAVYYNAYSYNYDNCGVRLVKPA